MTIWTQDPEAQALLAEAAKCPPERRTFTYRFGDQDTRYTGRIVRDLKRIQNRYLEASLDTPSFLRNMSVTVEQAIADAVGNEPFEESFRVEQAA